jgi:proline dehydrogenase
MKPFLKFFNSKAMTHLKKKKEIPSVNLHDYRRAFLYKDQQALRLTFYIFKVLSKPWLVSALTGFTTFALRLRLPIKKIIRNTIYKIFCAGETTDEAFATIKRLDWYQVSAVLDYVSEGETTEAAFDRNKTTIIENIRRLARETPGNSISVKLSGLEHPRFLEKISAQLPSTLHGEDLERYQRFKARVDDICAVCVAKDVNVYIDAEDRCMQDGFDTIACYMMAKHNKKKAVVYNTLQMYLKDRGDYLQTLIKHSTVHGYFAGIKLVRGAYVEKERESARKNGLPSPVHDSKTASDLAFDNAVTLCLEQSSHVYTCIASHNEQSTMHALHLIEKLRITDHRQKVKFSQLFGMSDNLTFNLAARGFNASKYLPYGEVDKAVPYLIRRAEENSSIGGQMPKELVFVKAELERRSRHLATLQQ